VVDATTALSTHLSETIRAFLPDLLSRQQTKEMVDRVGQSSPKLVEELVPKLVSIGEIQRVLRQLLRERVPIRDLTTILEAIADSAAVSKDFDVMVEQVRAAIGRMICRQYQTDKGDLPAIQLAPALEERLLASVVRTDRGSVLALEPSDAQNLAVRLGRALETAVAQPVLLCSPTLRPHLWRLFAKVLPHLGVMSHVEVPTQVRLATVATID
jgi:flagellar biosynthesis protein FlhA